MTRIAPISPQIRLPWMSPTSPTPTAASLPTDVATIGSGPAAARNAGPTMSAGKRLAMAFSLLLAGGMPLMPGVAAAQQAMPVSTQQLVTLQDHVLGPGRMLKADQFPTLQAAGLRVVDGAPNFRQIPGEPIYGVAQPTVDGIRNALREVGAGPGGNGPTALWTNLREEPVIYINGRPFNPRDIQAPFANLENPGASTRDVEASDEALKKDILAEASRNGGNVMVYEETADGKVVGHLEPLRSVQTPREVYEQLQQEGFRVDYARVPISDEKAPGEDDFEALVARLKNVDPNRPLIFNCHAGRGRTTTGMVIADLMRRADHDTSIVRSKAVHEDIREQGDYKTGNYRVILSLIHAIEQGPESKVEADAAIDRSSTLQNLRESIQDYRNKANDPSLSEEKRQAARQRGEDYLKRYFYLISFDAYVGDQGPSGFKEPFGQWMEENGLRDILGNLQLAMGFTPTVDVAFA
jgi:hypothetical protein